MPSLPTTTVFSGSQSLTATLTAAGSDFSFGAGIFAVPGGQTAQYRLRVALSGLTNYDYPDVVFQTPGDSRYRFAASRPDRLPDRSGNGWHAHITKAAGVTESATFLGYGTKCAALDASAPGLPSDTTCIVAGALALTNPGTVEMAFQRSRTSTTECLFGNWGDGGTNGGQYLVYLDGSNRLNCAWYNASASVSNVNGSATVGTGGAHWAAVSYDGTTLRLYLDGALQASSVTTLGQGPYSGPSLIGRSYLPTYNPFSGKVDQCRASSVARYTGSTYTVPSAAFTVDANTVCYLDFEADSGLASMVTKWFPVPSGSATHRCLVRNRLAAAGTVTSVTIEARTVGASAADSVQAVGTTAIVTRGGAGAPDHSDCAAPVVFYDSANSRWVCAYSGYSGSVWTLCLAYAAYDAGLPYYGLEGSWTKEAANPVFSPNGTTDGTLIACNGSVQKLGSTWYHFYNGDSFSVRLATASSLTGTWTRALSGADVIKGFDSCGADPQFVARGVGFQGCWIDRAGTFASREFWYGDSPDGLAWRRLRLFGPPNWWGEIGEPGPVWVDDGDGNGVQMRLLMDMDNAADAGRSLAWAASVDGKVWGFHGYALAPDAGRYDTVQDFDSDPILLPNSTVAVVHSGAPLAGNVGMNADLGLAFWQIAAPVLGGAPTLALLGCGN